MRVGPSRARLPLAEPDALAGPRRDTRRVWAVLATALVVLVTAAVLLTLPGAAPGAGVLPRSGSTVMVIDLSGSTRTTLQRIAGVLLGQTRNGDRKLGLVVFSDTGYEALPLSEPAEALRSWLALLAGGAPATYPWTPSFSGGTVISSGLSIARSMLLRSPAAGRHVLLVSDLVDGIIDLPRLQSIVALYQREQIDLRLVTVTADTKPGAPSSASFLQLPNSAFVAQAASHRIDPARLLAPHRRRSPALLVAVVVAAGLLAAAYELTLHPLTWRGA